MSGFDRRAYARIYARKRRAARLAAKNVGAATCQRGLGRFGVCGGVLETVTDGHGSTRVLCPLCRRRERGICRDCGLPVAGTIGRAIRCAYHLHIERNAASERYRERSPDEARSSARGYYRARDDRRERRNEYKRAWRKANRDKVRAQKRRANLRGRGQATQARRRALGIVTPTRNPSAPRLCVTIGCEIVVTRRKKKCTRCKDRERQEALKRLAEYRRSA